MFRTGFRSLLLLLLFASGLVAAETIVSEEITEPFPGIRIVERVTADPPRRIFAAFIAVGSDSHSVDATAPTRQARTVEEWAKETGALVAVNGDFFKYTDGVPHVYGDAVGGGERWPEVQTGRGPQYAEEWFHRRYGWIAFGGKGVTYTHTQLVKNQSKSRSGWRPAEVTSEVPPGTRALISGFPELVIDGEPVVCVKPAAPSCFPDRTDMRDRHPRAAMGLTRDHQTFILVVVDGRSQESVGMYGSELAALMHELGAWTAFNIDGGGSAQMYVQGRGIINKPSGRKVLNHWGVFPASQGK